MQVKSESYLKSGSNELRVLEYTVNGLSFGINILKVSKIVKQFDCFTQAPEAHPSVAGFFRDRDKLVPVIDLGYHLGLSPKTDVSATNKKVVITEFFGQANGLFVDEINWIHHFYWEDLIDASDVLKNIESRFVSGIVRPDKGERMVFMLDYESIILDLCPNLEQSGDITQAAEPQIEGRGMRALVAEDSPAVRAMLELELSESGFDVIAVSDGKAALEKIEENPDFQLVISDVEMPRMDGLALLVAIREKFGKTIPVMIYSSIGDMGMKKRAEFLEADAHITKLNVNELRMVARDVLVKHGILKGDGQTEQVSGAVNEAAVETSVDTEGEGSSKKAKQNYSGQTDEELRARVERELAALDG